MHNLARSFAVAFVATFLVACASTVTEKDSAPPVATADGPTYVLRDNGKRCITSPCFSWSATAEDGSALSLSGVDTSELKLATADEQKLRGELMKGAWNVRGRVTHKQLQTAKGSVFVVEALAGRVAPVN